MLNEGFCAWKAVHVNQGCLKQTELRFGGTPLLHWRRNSESNRISQIFQNPVLRYYPSTTRGGPRNSHLGSAAAILGEFLAARRWEYERHSGGRRPGVPILPTLDRHYTYAVAGGNFIRSH
jgi:hypothetical protein